MRRDRLMRRLAWQGAVLLLSLSGAIAAADAVTVITAPDQKNVKLDRAMLRGIYTMRVRQWPNGQPVRVFVLPDRDPLHEQFSRENLGTYPYVLRGLWDRLVFTGTGFAPLMVESEAEMRQRVRSTPGAIGYVRAQRQGAGHER